MLFFRKPSARRDRVRKNIAAGRLSKLRQLANTEVIGSATLWLLFVLLCTAIFSAEKFYQGRYADMLPSAAMILIASVGAALYIAHYQKRITRNHARVIALACLVLALLAATRIGVLITREDSWAMGTAIAMAIILTIAYNQRFALGMSTFYCILANLAAGDMMSMNLFTTMYAGSVTCCFALREIRTRTKLLEVGAVAAAVAFATSTSMDFFTSAADVKTVFLNASFHALTTFGVALVIQSVLPLIEKAFKIATSMTLLDYSDANQPLLKRLAMEAPGTFSHSLLVGSIAEAAAEAIGRNGLLCRVGAYYHDIGKINKPEYFIENEMGSKSKHKELSPAMSQLIIVGHVKDGAEMAKEYKLPAVIRQFIETHHGKTLVEYFYNEAKKKTNGSQPEPSESEFRYAGPRPRTKEAAIVMLADAAEGAVRSLSEVTATRIEAVVHNMAMKRLQDGQFDECDISLRELSLVETSITKTLAAHYHGRIAYPKPAYEEPQATASPDAETEPQKSEAS